MGTVSSLANNTILADISNYTQGRNGYKICKITPHIMAGVLTAEQCAKNIFGNPNRNASANYCIGNAGDIVCNVYEEDRAWTSSNRANDYQAITIEVSNSSTGGKWAISDEAWNSLVALCVDICKRYNFRLTYDSTPNGSLTRHNMFKNTNCPGPYLQSRFQELADIVNAKLDGQTVPNSGQSTATTVTESQTAKEQIDVDGRWGQETTRKAQKVFGTPMDGVVSNQHSVYKDKKGLLASTFKWKENPSKNGSVLIKAIQEKIGVKKDGFIGPKTIRGMQMWLGTTVDGYVSDPSEMVRAFQEWLNAQ